MPAHPDMPSTYAPPRWRWPVALAALLAHALLWVAVQPLLRGRQQPTVVPAEPPGQLLLLRLPSALRPAAPVPAAPSHGASPITTARATAPKRTSNPPQARSPTVEPAPLQAITEGAAPPQPAPTGPAPATTAPPAPLQLLLPRTDRASAPPAAWARRDERVNQGTSRSARFAQTLGTDLTERRDTLAADGATRIRRGNDCVLVKDSRDSQLDPFNASTRAAPKQQGAC